MKKPAAKSKAMKAMKANKAMKAMKASKAMKAVKAMKSMPAKKPAMKAMKTEPAKNDDRKKDDDKKPADDRKKDDDKKPDDDRKSYDDTKPGLPDWAVGLADFRSQLHGRSVVEVAQVEERRVIMFESVSLTDSIEAVLERMEDTGCGDSSDEYVAVGMAVCVIKKKKDDSKKDDDSMDDDDEKKDNDSEKDDDKKKDNDSDTSSSSSTRWISRAAGCEFFPGADSLVSADAPDDAKDAPGEHEDRGAGVHWHSLGSLSPGQADALVLDDKVGKRPSVPTCPCACCSLEAGDAVVEDNTDKVGPQTCVGKMAPLASFRARTP
ncbi:unnamed protein product [Symbiodinium sp. CCMP2592]|nr:unnamed protein product [Symbiodinium sp. CCMP2592]